MAYSCVVCGKKERGKTDNQNKENQVFDENNEHIALHRFPLTKPALLEKWEIKVKSSHNKGNEWRASKHSYLCSNHFDASDYIICPSSHGTCRLKDNAVPSKFETHSPTSNIPEQARQRLQSLDEDVNTRYYTRKRLMNEERTMSPAAKVRRDHNYAKNIDEIPNTPIEELNNKMEQVTTNKEMKRKIKRLQQQLRRNQTKLRSMKDLINQLEETLIIKTELADKLHSTFDELQLSLFHNVNNNNKVSGCGRRYTDDIKEFALTLYFYSPKAYTYVRSILPLPNPSLIRKWASSVNCEPGFFQETFKSLQSEAKKSPLNKDCCLIIDAMAIRKQILCDQNKGRYVGSVDYGPFQSDDPERLASEALVFLLVGTRSHWKCPIGYFLCDKMTANHQAQLITMALEMAAESNLRVWSITMDGTTTNISTFRQLGCEFGTTFDKMRTKFKHPTQDYFVYVVLDPSHMLKLARNALGSLSSFTDQEGNNINWHYFQQLNNIQQDNGMKLGNKLSARHLKFQKHKMNVSLAAQTLSSSVANAIDFLNNSLKMPQFQGSEGTVKFTRTIDRLFDILNSRNVSGKGYKQPLRLQSKHVWEPILRSTAEYLLGLKVNNSGQLLAKHKRKTFVIGFVATIKTTIEMANEMLKLPESPFQYILTYRFSQDHIELLFSCIRSKGGWNNNPNVSQLKYALRKMLLRNAITASKNANCVNWMENFSGVIPFFHKKKHTSPIVESAATKTSDNISTNENKNFPQEVKMMGAYLCQNKHTEFLSNILFYVSGYIASKLIKILACSDCKKCLLSLSPTTSQSDHDYCGVKSVIYDEVSAASAFTLFVNNGGLKIPSKSVYQIIDCAEHVFRQFVPEHRNQISHEKNLKAKMVVKVCQYFILEQSNLNLFHDHDEGMHESSLDDDHRINLTKHVADKYFTLRLFSYGKQYCENVIKNGEPSHRHQLTKLILFKNE